MKPIQTAERGRYEVANHFRQVKEAILNDWEAQARLELPAAMEQSKPALYNQLPEYLDQMILALAGLKPGDAACGADAAVCKEHGEQRAGLRSYSLKQVIAEYELLRITILKHLEVRGSVGIDIRECIYQGISEGIGEAASEYSRVQDSLREQFVAVLTHDLRNPLSAIRTSAQMIVKRSTDSRRCQSLASRIADSTKRIDGMIQDLLDTFSLRVGQKLPIQISHYDLSVLMHEVVEELTTIYGNRFILDSPPEVWGYWSTEGLRRAVENLANNAVKYGDAVSSITIQVDRCGSEVQISVHNRGAPLIAEHQAELFEPYHRTPLAQTSGKKGWGLGLTLVRGMAEAHGGRVDVKSSEELGTTFCLIIPTDSRPEQVA